MLGCLLWLFFISIYDCWLLTTGSIPIVDQFTIRQFAIYNLCFEDQPFNIQTYLLITVGF